MSLYRKARPDELVVTQPAVTHFAASPVVTTVVTLEVLHEAMRVEAVAKINAALDRNLDRHKGSRAAYMREYRAKQKAPK